MHPATLWSLAADAHTDELRRRAAETRRAEPAPSVERGRAAESVVIRLATPEDAPALARLEELDSKPLGDGAALVAEIGGRAVAALAVESGQRIADPFLFTADILRLLDVRAGQLRGDARSRRWIGRSLRALALVPRGERAA